MEAVGLTVGLIALASLFNSAVEDYQYLRSARNFTASLATTAMKFKNARLKLSRWAQHLGVDISNVDEATLSKALSHISQDDIKHAEVLVAHIVILFKRTAKNLSKFGGNSALQREFQNPNLQTLVAKFSTESLKQQGTEGVRRKLRWALYGEKDLGKIVSDISSLLTDLFELFPASVSVAHLQGVTHVNVRQQAFFYVPLRRDLDFIHRPEFQHISSIIARRGGLACLLGSGGSGKTQVALEYCYKARDENPALSVFWVNASSDVSLERDMNAIANMIGLPQNASKSEIRATKVRDWLSSPKSEPWLLVFDNADGHELLREDATLARQMSNLDPFGNSRQASLLHVPASIYGSVVVTTRAIEVAEKLTVRSDQIVKLEAMSNTQAASLLQTADDDMGDEAASQLIAQLGSMPLAMSLAASHMKEKKMGVDEYLTTLVISDRLESLPSRPNYKPVQLQDVQDLSIQKTLSASYQRLRREKPSAAALLCLMSCYDPNSIPDFLLDPTHSGIYADLLDGMENSFEQDLIDLRNFGLLQAERSASYFTLHPLVKRLTFAMIPEAEQEKWMSKAVQKLAAVFPATEGKELGKCRQLLPHLVALQDWRPQSMEDVRSYLTVFLNAGNQMFRLDTMETDKMIESFCHSALQVAERRLDEKDKLIFEFYDLLACTLRYQGRFEEKEVIDLHLEALLAAIHGPDSTEVVDHWISAQIQEGQYDEAIRTAWRWIGKKPRTRKDSRGTMTVLAKAFMGKSEYDRAAQCLSDALRFRETDDAEGEFKLFRQMTDLTIKQSNWRDAEEYASLCFENAKKAFGQREIRCVRAHGDLGKCQYQVGRLEQARITLFECLSWLHIAGDSNELFIERANVLTDLALTLAGMGESVPVTDLLDHLLQIAKRLHTLQDFNATNPLSVCADRLWHNKQWAKALELHEVVLGLYEDSRGKENGPVDRHVELLEDWKERARLFKAKGTNQM